MKRALPPGVKRWGGRHSTTRVALTLANKGTICHLCGLPGADTADHDPPRSVLIATGVGDPDALEFLNPAHARPCNLVRGAREITQELRAECRAKRLAALGEVETVAGVSSRFAAVSSRSDTRGSAGPALSPRFTPQNPEGA